MLPLLHKGKLIKGIKYFLKIFNQLLGDKPMKKLFTILAMVLATILISSCSEDAPTQPIVDEEFTVKIVYSNSNYTQQWYIHVWVYDDKGVFVENFIEAVPKSGSPGYQYASAKKGWEVRFGRSLELFAKENTVVKLYKKKIYEKSEFFIE